MCVSGSVNGLGFALDMGGGQRDRVNVLRSSGDDGGCANLIHENLEPWLLADPAPQVNDPLVRCGVPISLASVSFRIRRNANYAVIPTLSILLSIPLCVRGQASPSPSRPDALAETQCAILTRTISTTKLLYPHHLPAPTHAPCYAIVSASSSPTIIARNAHFNHSIQYPRPDSHAQPIQNLVPRHPFPQEQVLTITADPNWYPFSPPPGGDNGPSPSQAPSVEFITETFVGGSLVPPSSSPTSANGAESISSSSTTTPQSGSTLTQTLSGSSSPNLELSSSSSTSASSSSASSPTNRPLADVKLLGLRSVYIIPILSVAGVIVICVVAWMIYACLHRKPKLRVRAEEEEGLYRGPGVAGTGRGIRDRAKILDIDGKEEMKRRRNITGDDDLIPGPMYISLGGGRNTHDRTKHDEDDGGDDWMGGYGYDQYHAQPRDRGGAYEHLATEDDGRLRSCSSARRRDAGEIVWPKIAIPPPMKGDIRLVTASSRSRSNSQSRSRSRSRALEDPFLPSYVRKKPSEGARSSKYVTRAKTRNQGYETPIRPEPRRHGTSLAMLQSYWSSSDSDDEHEGRRIRRQGGIFGSVKGKGSTRRVVNKKKSWVDSLRGTASAILNTVAGGNAKEKTDQVVERKEESEKLVPMRMDPGISIPSSVEELEAWDGVVGGLVNRRISNKQHRRNDSDIRVGGHEHSQGSRSAKGYFRAEEAIPTPRVPRRHRSSRSHRNNNASPSKRESRFTEMDITSSIDSAAVSTTTTPVNRGFRIITESPSPVRVQTFPTSLSQGSSGFESSLSVKDRMRELMKDDGYTALPEQGARSRSKSRSRSASRNFLHQSQRESRPARSNKGSKDNYVGKSAVDRDVLPHSPTQIMSPPLAEILTFSPPPMSFTTLAELDSGLNNSHATPRNVERKNGRRGGSSRPAQKEKHQIVPSLPIQYPFTTTSAREHRASPSTPRGHTSPQKLKSHAAKLKSPSRGGSNNKGISTLSPRLPSSPKFKIKAKGRTPARLDSQSPTKPGSSKDTDVVAQHVADASRPISASLRLPLPLPLPLARLASGVSSGSEYTTASGYDPGGERRGGQVRNSKAYERGDGLLLGRLSRDSERERMADEALRKVQEIMASSWSMRDVEDDGMRSLSPNGFGKRI